MDKDVKPFRDSLNPDGQRDVEELDPRIDLSAMPRGTNPALVGLMPASSVPLGSTSP
jgi:hypothetical protein